MMRLRALALLAALLLAAPAHADTTVIGPGASALPGFFDPVRDHAAPTDGTTDAAAQINASLTDCQTAGGGRVTLGPYQFVVSSADLTVPSKCSLDGTWYGGGVNPVSAWIGSSIPKLLLSSAHTIKVGGSISNLMLIRQGMTNPVTTQDVVAGVAAFAGTAISTIAANDDVRIHDMFIVGFDQCVDFSARQRLYAWNLLIDCNKGLKLDNVHDVAHVWGVHQWGFYPGNFAPGIVNTAVSGVANNGSGLIRLTVGDTSAMATGNTVYVTGVGGYSGANGAWVATAVDATHLDLQGSSFVSFTHAGTWASGETFVTLDSLTGVAPGENVSGTNIAGATTVRAVDFSKTGVWLSTPTTGAGSATTLTFSSNAYTSGGNVKLDTTIRPGPFVSVTNSEEVHFSDMFAWANKVGYYVGVNSIWAHFNDASCDGGNPGFVCMEWDSSARLAEWNGGQGGGGGALALLDQTSGTISNAMNGVQIRTSQYAAAGSDVLISVHSGSTSQRELRGLYTDGGPSPNTTSTIAIYGSSGSTFIDGQMPGADLYPQNSTTMASVDLGRGTKFASGSPYRYEPQLSWTPTFLVGGGGNPTYVARTGQAEIAWPYMSANYQVALSAIGGTGLVSFSGLPFSCNSAAEANLASAQPVFVSNLTGLTSPVVNYVPDSALSTWLVAKAGSTSLTQLADTDLTASAKFVGTIRCRMGFVQR